MTLPSLQWQNLPAPQLVAVPELAAQWDRLNAAHSNLPFLSAYAMAAALGVFGRGDERLLVARQGTHVVAMFLLQRCGTARWQTFQPSQIPLGAWVAVPELALQALAQSLMRGPLGLCLVLSLTQLDPLFAARAPDGPAWTSADYIDTGWVEVQGSFEDFWSQRGKNLRSNMRKQRNKLAAEGSAIEFVERRSAPEMAEALQRFGVMESSGWKSQQGTAIHADNAQGRFYRQLLEEAASRGEAVVYELLLAGRTVAANLCLQRGGTLVVLKTAYDESLDKSLSPAFLLQEEQLQRLFATKGMRRVEYYGRFLEWHSRWTEHKRTLHHMTLYRWPWLKRLRQLRTPAPVAAAVSA